MGFSSSLIFLVVTALISTFGLTFGAVANSEDCVDYGTCFHWEGNFRIEGQMYAVDVNDTHAFVAARTGGLLVFDLSKPEAPAHVATMPCGQDAMNLQIHENVAVVHVDRDDETREGYIFTDTYLVDISQPVTPSIILKLEPFGYHRTLEAFGHLYFCFSDGLRIIDVTDLGSPQILDSDPIQERVMDLEVVGNHLLALTPTRLCALDLTNPGDPLLVTELEIQSSRTNLSVVGDRLFVANGEKLFEISLGDPGNPYVIAEFPADQIGEDAFTRHLIATENHALISCAGFDQEGGSAFRLHVFDIKTPGQPVPQGSTALPENPKFITYREPVLYGRAGAGIFAVDCSNPDMPATVMNTNYFAGIGGISWNETHLYSTSDVGLSTYAFEGGGGVPPLGRIETPGLARGLAISGNHAYVADWRDGVQVIELQAGGNGSIVASLPVSGPTTGVLAENQVLYIGDRSNGLLVVDVGDPASPTIDNTISLEKGADILASMGDLLGVASSTELIIYDKRNPAAPMWVGAWQAPSVIQGFVMARDMAFVTTNYELIIADLDNPDSISKISSIPLPGAGRDLAVVGDYAYVGTFRNGLVIVDVADPSAPIIVGRKDLPDGCSDVTVYGDHAYVSAGQSGVQIIDVTDPYNPELIGRGGYIASWPAHDHLLYFARSSVIAGGILYTVEEFGLQALPLQCGESESPVEVTVDLKPGNESERINCSSNGVIPVAILTTDDFNAVEIDHETVVFGPGRAHESRSNKHGMKRHEKDVDHDGDVDLLFHFRAREAELDCSAEEIVLEGLTFAGQQIRGSVSFRKAPPKPQRKHQGLSLGTRPNPFNPQTTIAFEIPAQEAVTLRVFDMSGRLVRELVVGKVYAPGRHEIVWNGRDDTGRHVASGIYFCRLAAGPYMETKRMNLLK